MCNQFEQLMKMAAVVGGSKKTEEDSVNGLKKAQNSELLERRSAKVEQQYVFEQWRFSSVCDHILASKCPHPAGQLGQDCMVCEFDSKLDLPHLPEMIFPNNKLKLEHGNGCIEFNALDGLKQVDSKKTPSVKVGPSRVWMSARNDSIHPLLQNSQVKPFDWTFTTKYGGTLTNMHTEETDERIDMDQLRVREPIQFYTQTTLFEDELADHGCASLSARLRVMPKCFFALQRFYLRIDDVLVRVVDTRLFGRKHSPHIIREWSWREKKIPEMTANDRETVLDPNTVWTVLPVTQFFCDKITPAL